MDGLQALALAKKYVANTAESLGSLRGSPCTVKGQRIDEDGNTIVTLGWTGTNGTNQTLDVKILKGTDGVVGKDGDSAFAKVEKVDDTVTITVEDKTGVTTATVKDGKDGERGATFIDAYFNEQNKLVLVLENGTELPPFSLPLAKVEISKAEGNAIQQKNDGLYAPEIDEGKYATKQELTAYAKSETLEGFVKKEDGKVLVEEAKVTQIDTNKNAIGDMSKLPVAVWNDLVTAISGLYSNFMQKLEYKVSEDGKKVVEITYRSGGKVEVDVSSIITDTNIGELSDVEVEGITEGQVIAYDSSSKKFKPHSIDLTGTLKSAKDYTDEKIAGSQESIAIACDEKPIHDENGDVTYKQNGVTTTVENPASWFYYKEEEITKQTRWIDNVEFTIDVGAMKLDDYVNKETDVVSEYADNPADTTKIPDLAYIAGLKTKIQQLISAKINTSDIVDNLVSSETAKPLSAKQGKELKALIDEKPDSEDIPEVVNDLATEATDKALSATQGKVLKGITDEILVNIDGVKTNLNSKADKDELNKRREIRVAEIYDSNNYHKITVLGHYGRPLYFKVVNSKGGEEILSFGNAVTNERKIIGKSVDATFRYIPPASNATNGTLLIKANKSDISLTIFYTQVYSLASIPVLEDSTSEEYNSGTAFTNIQNFATQDYVNVNLGGKADKTDLAEIGKYLYDKSIKDFNDCLEDDNTYYMMLGTNGNTPLYTTGWYYVSTERISNARDEFSGYDQAIQRAYNYNTGATYIRFHQNTWSAWQELATMDNVASKDDISMVLESTVTLAKGANTITFKTPNPYMLIASGNNYGQGICMIAQGWSSTVIKATLAANNISFGSTDYSATKTMTVTNNSEGEIELKIYRIR